MRRTSDTVIDSFNDAFKAEFNSAGAWREYLDFEEINFDDTEAKLVLSELRNIVVPLANLKSNNPTEKAGTNEEQEKAELLWNNLVHILENKNRDLRLVADKIRAFKGDLNPNEESEVVNKRTLLKIRMNRYISEVID